MWVGLSSSSRCERQTVHVTGNDPFDQSGHAVHAAAFSACARPGRRKDNEMRRSVLVATLAAAVSIFGFSAAAGAATSDGPYAYSAPDSGTCHPYDGSFTEVPWALDIGNRVFTTPAADPAGNYNLTEFFRTGSWVSSPDPGPNGPGSVPAAGPHQNYSPGSCDTGSDAGHRITAGQHGTFKGKEKLFVQNGTYTAGDTTCAGEDANGAPNPCTTGSYIAYHYGPSASITVTSYKFVYTGGSAAVAGQQWTDSYDGTTFTDTGDIFNVTVPPVAPSNASSHVTRNTMR